MTNIVNKSPELRQFLAAPETKQANQSAFEAHGIWTPGVLLMRNLRFTIKSLVICAMFLIPLCVLAWFYNSSMAEIIRFSAKERVGVAYIREIFPVLDLAQQLRRDATNAVAAKKDPDSMATMAGIREKLVVAQARLTEVDKRLGAELNTAKMVEQCRRRMHKPIPARMWTAFSRHTPCTLNRC